MTLHGRKGERIPYSRSRSGSPKPRQLIRAGVHTVRYDGIKKATPMDTETNEPVLLNSSHLGPPRGQLDESCAGIPLDTWRRGDPLDSVVTAARFVADHPETLTMAYCHDISPAEWALHDKRQKEAGKAWAAREFPHLNIRFRVMTLPYQGIGNDVHVIYAEVVKPKKVTP